MISNTSFLRPVGGRPYARQLQAIIDERRQLSTSGLPEVKSLPARLGQEFLGYLGSRLRTAAKRFHNTKFVSDVSQAAFEKKIKIEFDNTLQLLAILVSGGKHFAVPAYINHCIHIEGDQSYKIGMGFDTEDGLTVLLTDSEDDWWINGNEPPSDVPSLLRAWRRFQTLSKPVLFGIETASDERLDHHYESVKLSYQAFFATYGRYKSQLEAVQMEIQELEIALPVAEEEELELYKARYT